MTISKEQTVNLLETMGIAHSAEMGFGMVEAGTRRISAGMRQLCRIERKVAGDGDRERMVMPPFYDLARAEGCRSRVPCQSCLRGQGGGAVASMVQKEN